jgi:hypothetical protein
MAGVPREANNLLLTRAAKDILRAMIFSALGYAYLKNSQRVKKTFLVRRTDLRTRSDPVSLSSLETSVADRRPDTSQEATRPEPCGLTTPPERTQRCDICGEHIVWSELTAHLRAHKAE